MDLGKTETRIENQNLVEFKDKINTHLFQSMDKIKATQL
jgi:hypothetical protein